MKLKKLIYGVPLAVLLITAGSSCRKGQFNINKNINQPTDSSVTYDVVLPSALHASGVIIAQQWGTIQNWMSFWARSGTYAPNVTEETYQITTGFGNGIWNACYDNNYDYAIVQSKANQAGASFYEGIARIMKAQNFQILVDVYGNVPYSEALKGSGNPTPKYDNGLAIYQSLLREIDAGMALIKNAVVTPNNANKNIWSNDIIFGDPSSTATTQSAVDALVTPMRLKWRKFGNTLKLRMLIHAYAVGAIDKAAEITIINNEGAGYLGVGENVQVQPGYKSDKPNPFYNSYVANTAGTATANSVYYKANDWGINYYAYNGDPRISRFYAAGSNGLTGVAYGLPPTTANSAGNLAGIGPGVTRSNSSPQAILTSAESFFLQAEARQRGWITSGPSAATLLNTGIQENFVFLGLTTAQANSYIAGNAGYPDVDINAPALLAGLPAGGIFTILSQKWFALNAINTLEVWTDWRRVPYSEVATKLYLTGGPAPTTNFVYGDGVGYDGTGTSPGVGPFRSVSPQITTTDNIPVRYLYPQTEYNYNTANVAAQGVITRFSRVFWDLN